MKRQYISTVNARHTHQANGNSWDGPNKRLVEHRFTQVYSVRHDSTPVQMINSTRVKDDDPDEEIGDAGAVASAFRATTSGRTSAAR